ncbi:MAG TPA: proton-conducting transporter membrane subunit [Solirubrobacteraceae bacterium]|nr:proton-conducting transporter membrane subunit [Solirubrobacteraceae bacterium]
MSALPALAVAVPLLLAAVLAGAQAVCGRRVADLLAIAGALTGLAICVLLTIHTGHGLTVYWFGGWRPRHGLALGIAFAVDPIGSGLAAFICGLTTLALLFSCRTTGVKAPHYHVLMLTFMAGMVGFCLSGDLFNMFVFFELMSVSAIALIGYKISEQAALEGALNFAVINMIGSFLFLTGIALIYAHTGALNLAQIGAALAHGGDHRVVVAAFVLIACALLIKAGMVPFHFWLADAYSVALAPVCILLAGAMSELGLYGLARIWFSALAPGLHRHTAVLSAILVALGLLTALWGAVMALRELDIKRLLAFVTISFVGTFLAGFGLLSPEGIAGVAVYVVADGSAKGLLFGCVGILQARRGVVGQARLHGRGRDLVGTGVLFALGGLFMGSLPPFGTFLGKAMIDDAALRAGDGFLPPVVALASALTSAAILVAGARVFLGWGPPLPCRPGDADAEAVSGDDAEADLAVRTPRVMTAAVIGLAVVVVAAGVYSPLDDLATRAAGRFVDVGAYDRSVLHHAVAFRSSAGQPPHWFDYLYGAGSVLLALAVAAVILWAPQRGGLLRALKTAALAVTAPLADLHTGRIGDYAAALVLGVGAIGALMIAVMR